MNLDYDDLPIERALGVAWSVEHDTLGFNIVIDNRLPTRRNILSVISTVYDPLGLASPFILPAKILVQDLCKRGIRWDATVGETDLHMWCQWVENLPGLAQVTIPRYYKPQDFGTVISQHIHSFSDASEHGYDMVSYLRLVNDNGKIHCSLLKGKSRVSPLKSTTIPRMELTAATLAVCISHKVAPSLDISCVYYWTDSMRVLKYIDNETTRFKTFVANRVMIIREGSKLNQRKYVGSKSNPADVASRGLNVSNSALVDQWISGPEFGWRPPEEWPEMPTDSRLSDAFDNNHVDVNKHLHNKR